MSYLSDLQKEPWRFDFFAVLRRVERTFRDKPRIGDSSAARDEYVLLGQEPFLEFPDSNLSHAGRDEAGRLRIFVRFLGLLGPQGALPMATTQEVYGWRFRGDDAFPRFLDIFNHRFLQLFFRAWADARPIAQFDRPDADRFQDYVGSFVGVGTPAFRGCDTLPDLAKVAFAGLLAPTTKSASRLRGFIAGLFGVEVEIDELVGSYLAFDQEERTLLGQRNAGLGVDALIGGSVFSLQDKIRIRISVQSLAEYEKFMPTGRFCRQLADAVFFYLGDEVDWDLELALPEAAIEPMRLARSGRLGWTSWMAPKPPQDKAMRGDARFRPASRVGSDREFAS